MGFIKFLKGVGAVSVPEDVIKRAEDNEKQSRLSPGVGSILLSVFDGTRQPIPATVELLVRIRDGGQTEVHSGNHKGPSIQFTSLPFSNNFLDNYTVMVFAQGYKPAGFTPVRVSPEGAQQVDLMLLPEPGHFNFGPALWTKLAQTRPEIHGLLAQSATDGEARYIDLLEKHETSLAGLLNLTAAMKQIQLPGGTALSYLKEVVWDKIQQDRLFAYANPALIDALQGTVDQGGFMPAPAVFHSGATRSYKEPGEAGLLLTFHENDRKDIGGKSCVMVEPDMGYFRDREGHAILEVAANSITGGLTDPKDVYVLRWTDSRRRRLPEFDPPYTIEA